MKPIQAVPLEEQIPPAAALLLSAGYHAWRHFRALCSPATKGLSPVEEAKEVVGAVQGAVDLCDAIGSPIRSLAAVMRYLGDPVMRTDLLAGRGSPMVHTIDQILRNYGDKTLWGWWQAGLNLAALELCAAGTADGDRDRLLGEAVRVLCQVGMPDENVHNLFKTVRGRPINAVFAWLKKVAPIPVDLNLVRVKKQHGQGQFPEEGLLMALGCGKEGIELLRFLYERRPGPVSNPVAAEHLHISRSGVTKRYAEIPKPVCEALLAETGKQRMKAWRKAQR